MQFSYEEYLGDLVADAAYVDFGDIAPGTSLSGGALIAKLTSRFSLERAKQIAARFEVVATASDSRSGFQAAIFRELPLSTSDVLPPESSGFGRHPGQLWLGFRGTEVGPDLLADAALALTGMSFGQSTARENFYAQLVRPLTEGGYGFVFGPRSLNIAGHSLGGYHALNFATEHPDILKHAYTVNTGNIGGVGAALLDRVEPVKGLAFNILADRITNIQAIPGIQLVGSDFTGVRDGFEVLWETETQDLTLDPTARHTIQPVTDFYEAARVLAVAIGSAATNETINELVNAASELRGLSFERVLEPLWRLVIPGSAFPLSTSTDLNGSKTTSGPFTQTAEQLFRTIAGVPAGTYQLVPIVMSGDSVELLAREDSPLGTAVREAIVNLDPYAVVGAVHESRYDLSNFTDEYLHQRSQYVAQILAANAGDAIAVTQSATTQISASGYRYFGEDVTSGVAMSRVSTDAETADLAADPNSWVARHVFGNADADTINGKRGDDYLFGGGGADILNGNEGDDYLEGQAGNDTLHGSAGQDTLVGGEGFDTFVHHTGDGATTIVDGGLGDSISINLSYNLGSGQVRRMAATAGVYEDAHHNHFDRTGTTLNVSLEDGGKLIIKNFESGDYGIILPDEYTAPNAGNGALEHYIAPTIYQFPPGGLPSMVGDQPDVTANGGYLGYSADWWSGSGWGWTTQPDIIHIPNSWVPSTDTTSLERDGVITPWVSVHGGPGNSYIYGGSQADFITDDSAFFFGGWALGERGMVLGNDYIYAGDGADFIWTHSGDDHVYAGDGDDIINGVGDNTEWGGTWEESNWWFDGDRGWFASGTHTNHDEFFGEGGNDIISADVSTQTIDGGSGDDILTGGADGDIIEGGTGNDFIGGDVYETNGIWGATGDINTTIRHFGWNDHYLSETVLFGEDTLSGGDGDDIIVGGGGKDFLDGGNGNDRLIGDNERLTTDSWWSSIRLTSLQNLSTDPDNIGDKDVIKGGAGEDEILAGAGDDSVDGGADNDYIVGGGGADTIDGGSGDDDIFGDYPNVDEGNDILRGGDGNDNIYGYGGNDQLAGGAGVDYLNGGEGDDTLDGGAGHDMLSGGAGNDTLIAGTGGGANFGGAGNDTYVVSRGDGVQQLTDSEGANILRFGYGITTSDIRVQRHIAGSDASVAIYYGAADYVFMTMADFDHLAHIELANGSHLLTSDIETHFELPTNPAQLGDNSIHLNVNQGSFSLQARGYDLLVWYTGGSSNWADTNDLTQKGVSWALRPGTGYGLPYGEVLVLHNWYLQDPGTYVTNIRDASGTPMDLGLAAWNLPRTVNAPAGGGALVGNNGNDYLNGSSGDDILVGGGGADVLTSGAGNDVISGEDGNDEYRIGAANGVDVIAEQEGYDTIRFVDGIRSTDIEVHDTERGLEVIIGPAANNNRLLIAGWYDDAGKRIESWQFDGDGVSLSAAQIEMRITGNRRPIPLADIPEQSTNGTVPFSFTLPANTFVDPNGDPMTYTAELLDGTALPSWLAFDAATLTFSGAQPASGPASFDIRVQATDPSGLSSNTSFVLGRSNFIDGTPAGDNIHGGSGRDVIHAGAGVDYVFGGGGNDVIRGGDDYDILYGEAGNDDLDGEAGSEQMYGGDGDDVFHDTGSGPGDFTEMWGENGNDRFYSGPASTRILGGAGDDTIYFDRGDGQDELDITSTVAENDILHFGTGILPSQIVFDANYNPGGGISGSMILRIRNADGSMSTDSITLDGYLAPDHWGDNLLVGRIEFQSDPGTVWNRSDIMAFARAPSELTNIIQLDDAADTVDAMGGNDAVYGAGGNDVLSGGTGDDYIRGDAGNDTLNGNDGTDKLEGGIGNDTLSGGAGNDTLIGGDGDDYLRGGGGAYDLYDGGLGSDTYLVERVTTPYVQESISLNLGDSLTETNTILFGTGISTSDITVTSNDFGDFELHLNDPSGLINLPSLNISLESVNYGQYGITGTEIRFMDQPGVLWTEAQLRTMAVIGTDLKETIYGFSGNDVMRGFGGDDTLNGYAGNDDLRGGSGEDQLNGGAGDDTYRFGRGDGLDEVSDLEGTNQIALEPGITTSQVTLYRTSSVGRVSSQTVTGDDLVIAIDNGQEQLRIESFFDPAKPNAYSQLSFADGTVWNNATILANVVNVSGTQNSQTGTTGADTFTVDHRSDTVAGLAGIDTVNSSVSFILGSDVENLTLTGVLDLNATGNSLANTLTGNSGANMLDGRQGVDTLVGGAGDDTYFVNGTTNVFDDTVTELAGGGYDTMVVATRTGTLSANVEMLVARPSGGTGQYRYTGNSLDNVIDGTGAANSVNTVILDGGAGADVLIGGANGPNRYVIDNLGDTIKEVLIWVGDEGIDTIESTVSYTLPLVVEAIELTGSAATTATGNQYANTLNGSTGSGANTLIGLGGDDTYILGDGDIAQESAGQGNDTIMLASSAGFTDGNVSLSGYSNFENLGVTNAFGGATLTGDAGNNRLIGNASVNTLIGGAGNDTLSGNGGNDIFAGFGVATGADVIEAVNYVTADLRTVEYSQAENILASQLQFGRNDEDLVITAAPGSSVTVQGFFDGTPPNFRFSTYSGGLRYDYTAAQAAAAANATNGGPEIAIEFADTEATVGEAFVYQYAANAFTDIESQSSLVYTATLDDGSALPAWLSFNPSTRTFSGTPTGEGGQITVLVTATDAGSLQAADNFVIDVQGGAIIGTSGDDNLVGTASDDIMLGLEGNDTLNGAAGADQMSGGPGNDTYVVDDENDVTTELANEGTDLVQSSVTTTLEDNVENLTLTGSSSISGAGNALDNVLTGNSGSNTLTGDDGNDTLSAGSAGTDTLAGGLGNDTYLISRTSGITVSEASGEGTDLVQASVTHTLASNVENLTLTGSSAINGTGNALANVITGNSGNNTLTGGDGDDTLYGGSAGTDSLLGGLGNDTYTVDRSTGITVTESASQGTDLVQASVTYTLTTNVENLTLTGSAAINGTGNASANVIRGNSAANTLDGSTGTDTLIGGLGNDTYVVDVTTDVVTEAASEGTDLVQSAATYTLSANVENLTLTGSAAVNGTGNALANVITGNSGNNTLTGGDGDDSLNAGSAGTDVLVGGLGNDTYVIDRTTGITVTESASQGTDLVQASVTHTLASNVENLTLTGSSAINGTGNALANVITGNSGSNTLTGGDGDDTLNGGSAGTDVLVGGLGNDTYVVDRTTGITVTESASQGTDLVQASVTHTLAANVENLTLTGSAAVNGTGNALANVITGNSGNNTLSGGDGNDTLAGGTGADALSGGLGADIYRYSSGGGADTIDNVAADSAVDRLQVTDLASTAVRFTKVGNNLVMTRTAVTTDTVTVTNWYSATGNRLDFVNFTDKEVTAAQIETAVTSGGGILSLGGGAPLVLDQDDFRTTLAGRAWSSGTFRAAGEVAVSSKLSTGVESSHVVPIKNFANALSAEVGLDRLIGAMASFDGGSDRSVAVDLAHDMVERGIALAGNPQIQMLRGAEHAHRLSTPIEIAV